MADIQSKAAFLYSLSLNGQLQFQDHMDMVEQQEITLYQTKRRQHWTGYK
jgi:hypothetical protein